MGARIRIPATLTSSSSGSSRRRPLSSGNPWDWDNSILVPEAAFEANFGGAAGAAIDRIFVGVRGGAERAIEQARDIVRALLRYRHGGEDEFQLDSGEDRKRRLALVLGVVGAFLLASAAVALLVSSLNVMNSTLISTTERSYEIGLRRSLGASRLDVFWQFVVEAGSLSLVGAAIGLLGGMILVLLTSALAALAVPDWKLEIFAWGPVVAVVLPVLVSGLFSAYPAWRGAALDPVTALRRR